MAAGPKAQVRIPGHETSRGWTWKHARRDGSGRAPESSVCRCSAHPPARFISLPVLSDVADVASRGEVLWLRQWC